MPLTSFAMPGRRLRLGFAPLNDCAPLVMAQELGLFQQYGLRVVLSRELGWASIRDKVIHGDLDAAHAVVGMPVAATLGLGSIACDCLTGLVLSLHGNAITLSKELWHEGARDGASGREALAKYGGKRVLTFGAVSVVSSHYFLMRQWLAAAGIRVGRDARIVIVPPPQMVANLKAGHLDGFCVGEPWNSVAVQARVGWCAATSAELTPGHPEKVLMVRRCFAERHAEEHLALIAALLEACEWCDAPENREELAATLSRPAYVDVSRAALRAGLCGEVRRGPGEKGTVPDFCTFHRLNANEPSSDKAAWILQRMRTLAVRPGAPALDARLGRQVFRADLYEPALRLRESRRRSPVACSNPKQICSRLNRFDLNQTRTTLWTT